MNILAINPGHNGAAALLVDGELKFYIEEERLSRLKYDGNPFRGILEALPYNIDTLVLGGTNPEFATLPWTGEDPYSALIRKHNPNLKVVNIGHMHHLGHAAEAFYNSGFEDAVAVIVDGAGSYINKKLEEDELISLRSNKRYSTQDLTIEGFEAETIVDCSYPGKFIEIYKSLAGNGNINPFSSPNAFTDNTVTIVKAYEAVSDYLGFGFIEAGKNFC